jgi:2-methylcitrate dehydratase PrpD
VDTGTLAERLADYVCGLTYEDLPADVVTKAKDVIAHDLAIAVAGSRSSESAQALAFARGLGGSPGRARVIGTTESFGPLDATFVNAVMMRTLRQEDSILPSFIHPGPILIPAALAIADEAGATGADLVTALVGGYDVLGTLAGGDWSWNTGSRTSSHVFGAFGSAVVTARLLGCDRTQTAKAIGYAGNLGAMITYGFENHQYGLVARNGMTAAFLGEAGCPARPDALEGPYGFYAAQLRRMPDDLEQRMDDLGTRFEIMTSILKPHPSTAINLVPTRLLDELLAEHGIAGDDVATVVVSRSRQIDLVPTLHSTGPWESAVQTTSSLPFALAAVLLDGSVTAERLNRPDAPDILERARDIRIDLLDDPDLLRHSIELTTRTGTSVSGMADVGILRPPRPADLLGDDGIAAIGRPHAERLLQIVAELETCASVDELTECLIPDHETLTGQEGDR